MQCRCAGDDCTASDAPEMTNVCCFDVGSSVNDVGQSFAYNLYVCHDCGSIAKEDVWSRPGITWLDVEGCVVRTGPEVEAAGGYVKL